jgi:hypothetical protein
MRSFYFILAITLLALITNVKAQSSQTKFEPDYKILKYCIDSLGFPIIDLKDTSQKQKVEIKKELKNWYASHHELESFIRIYTYEQYFPVYKKLAIKTYPPKPKFVDTGNPLQDEINYKKKMKEWSENHPDYPRYIDTGHPKEDKERFRKARVAFYNKYIKEE